MRPFSLARGVHTPAHTGATPLVSESSLDTRTSEEASLTPENNLLHLAGRGWRGCRICLTERHALIRAAAKVTGLTWKGYAAGHGLSRAEAMRVLAEAGIDATAIAHQNNKQ